MTKNCVQVAVERAGSIQSLAKAAGVKYQAVQGWIKSGYIPPKRIKAVSDATGVTQAELFSAYQARIQEQESAAA
ncbi:hypothetical protein BUE93_20870 [Chromobacterium amazonense]|uniref:HTH cro/C1-type domain-containing protein n=1 Tax=Chromobacterium amazonense TaxID=1382803 RepID=A0A2S9WZ29_9NEIS|nr:YdaS family helix-turn-helix protein [Chromobacterium amazonense]PRP68720.1 hypothetical protein BUE93_20870 [Chromobacterium amazonense]